MVIFFVTIFSAHFMGTSVYALAQMTFSRIEKGF